MSIRHVREAFNQEADGHASCQTALLRYEDDGKGGQHQIITVMGTLADGSTFNLSTPAHAMQDDPHHHVRMLARSMKEPAPSVADKPEVTGPMESGVDPRPDVSRLGTGGSPPADIPSNPFSGR